MELWNTDAVARDLGGWRLSGGVEINFPAGTIIPAGGFLAVAADGSTFSAKHPGVPNFVSGWSGRLSNSTDTVRLRDAADLVVAEVTYADDGDWAVRERDDADHGHRGWRWRSGADGGGSSLELIRPSFANGEGQNWAASLVNDGTPGSTNSVSASNLPCVIDQVRHSPAIPRSSDVITVSCRVRDDSGTIAAVSLHHRVDGAPLFSVVPMVDDGAHGDGLAGDGIFGAVVPPASNGARVEFYVSASDGVQTRTWPAPVRELDGSFVQSQNCIFQIDNASYSGAVPIYRIVMRSDDAAELAAINSNAGTPPFPFNPGEANDQTQSHTRFNATFISTDGTGTKIRYLTGVRNRGNGSRTATPPNYNVHFLNDDRWNDRVALVLNSQNTPYQLLGSTLIRLAGLAGSESRPVRIRVNEVDPTGGSSTAPTYGFYVCNEFPDGEFAEHHFPLDSGGNIYRGQRVFTGFTAAGTQLDGASLRRITPVAAETMTLAELYAINFRKETNSSENDWSDLIALADALAKGLSRPTVNDPPVYEPDFIPAVGAAMDLPMWMRWLAANTLLDNEETNISNGDGDDYYLYFGRSDGRAVPLHHDLDTVLGRSAVSNSATHGIFRMCDDPNGAPTALNALMKHPEIAPLYYAELQRQLDTVFHPDNFEDTCDQMLAALVDSSVRQTIKDFNAARHAHVSGLIPRTLTVAQVRATDGTTLSAVNGYPQTVENVCGLVGFAPAIGTRSVKVNDAPAVWSAWDARWSASAVALTPGVNRIVVQAFDSDNAEIAKAWQDVWFFDGGDVVRTGTLSDSETWSAAGGPYRVSGDLVIPAGVTLTIEAGAVVTVAAGKEINVAAGGALIAAGSEFAPIRFMSVPGGGAWDGIIVNGAPGTPPTRISHAHISGNSVEAIDVHGGEIFLDHVTFGNASKQYLELENASYAVTNCIFPSATTAFEMVVISGSRPGGLAVFSDCFFGKTIGPYDTIDTINIQRPGPILHVTGNLFLGSDDDILDLDSSDAWIEGNVFMRAHRNGVADTSSAISAGSGGSEITVTGNFFIECDHAATATDGCFITLLCNTIVAQGNGDSSTAVVNFSDPGSAPGAGMVLEGNIIHSAVAIAVNASAPVALTLNNNLLPMAWNGVGAGNTVAASLLTSPLDIPIPDMSDYIRACGRIRAALTPVSQSPAKKTGPHGRDKGAVNPPGVSLTGVPAAISNSGSALITVGTLLQGNGIPAGADAFPGGSGWTHYRWRIDGGVWSGAVPISRTISISGLSDGLHTLEVSGLTDGGLWQDDPLLGVGVAVAQWTVQSGYVPPTVEVIRINEVLALNSETFVVGGVAPDMIELFNSGTAPIDVSGWGLSDSSGTPFKFTFPAGTTIEPGGYLTVYASASPAAPQPRTGFAIKREGDEIILSRPGGAMGSVVDSVIFGRQLSDYSLGRAGDGTWALCRPTFGAANILSERAGIDGVVINEWLAASAVLSTTDFIELFNPAVYPVNIGGCLLTDNPADWPARHVIRPLTFIEPGGYAAFWADDQKEKGPDHLPFKLDPLQGEIGLLAADLTILDTVVYSSQRADVSEGLTPNGAGDVASFNQPTPGGPNPAVAGTISVSTQLLVPANHAWRYFASGAAAPANDAGGNSFWMAAYDDSAWAPYSQQILHIETAALANAEGFTKGTPLPGITATRPFQTYYFRTHFTYNGPLTGVALSAVVMCDDGANIYLNGGAPTTVRMNAGATGYLDRANASVGDATVQVISLPAEHLVQGDNVITVSVHQFNLQSSGSPSSDVVWGMKLNAAITTVFPVVPVVLNELLVSNTALQNLDGSVSGWVEIFNPAGQSIDISDMSLSDDVALPRKFVIPAGTVIPAGGRHIVQFNPLAPAGAVNTGWALPAEGGTLGIYHVPANAGALHDSISFGRQIPNYSIARVPDGSGAWTLAVPSRAAFNSAAATGQITDVKLNEWRSDEFDFIELFNSGPLPVDLGGCFLTDSVSSPAKFPIPPLSFIGAAGNSRWQVWLADSLPLRGHVNFDLQSADSLALFSASGSAIDIVASVGGQPSGRSAGRFPENSAGIAVLVPTPGLANQVPVTDSDGDGIPDAWESDYALNPNLASDAGLDADGDGQSNLAEFIAGTNPRFPGDAFKAEVTFGGTGGRVIRFVAVAGRTYSVQYKTSLNDPAWQKIGDVSAQNVTGIVEVPDPFGTEISQRFYRIVTPSVP